MQLRLGNAALAYVVYLAKTVYPINLAVIYPLLREIPTLPVMASAMMLIVISWLVRRRRRREPYLLTGWLWFLVTLLPVIGLAQVGAGNAAMADRYTYFPQIGFLIGSVFCISHWTARLRLEPMVLFPVAGAVLAGCLFVTARQLQYWRDNETLFRRALAVIRDNSPAQNYLGNILLQQGEADEAIAHLQTSIALEPENSQAHNNLGWAFVHQGQIEEAIGQFQRALEIEPGSAKLHFNLGAAYDRTGETDKAIGQYQTAIQLQPDLAQARNNLGNILLQKGRTDEATAQFQEGVKLLPRSTMLRNNLGDAYLRQGKLGEAMEQFRKSLEIQADNAGACRSMAWVLATCPDSSFRDGGRAVELAQEANEIYLGRDPEVISTLAAAYAEAGKFPEAMASARQALQLAAGQNNAAFVNLLQAQMVCYQSGLPFRDVSLTNALPSESRP
jgi:Flp pilus assembly protein TadD